MKNIISDSREVGKGDKVTTSARSLDHLESAHDILRTRRHPLNHIFAPKVVAVIGATESKGSVGRTVFQNLGRGGFEGVVYLVNPKRSSVLCVKAYPNIGAIPEKVDLAVICTPATTVPAVIRDCAKAGVPGAIVISAGFKEIGKVAKPGNVAFLSQSGALCTAILDWSLKENVGFSAFASLGSMLDVGWSDLIYYLGDDPNTKSIIIYMETIGDARGFLSAAREVSLTKPIIVIKPGRTEQAAKAAASHTGSLTGSDEVLQAAFRRVGVLRVETISELFDMAEVLGKQPRPKGPRLTIVTNAGGPGVLATDSLITSGAQLAALAPETMAAFNKILPPTWSHNNPVDIIGDAGADLYAQAVDIAANDPNTDGLLVILTPQAMTDATATAKQLVPVAKAQSTKPILASWMGADAVEPGEAILNAANIPTFKYPDRAARAFYYMWRYSDNLRSLYETPAAADDSNHSAIDRAKVDRLLQTARKTGRTILTEYESKQLLAAYGIPTVETHIAHTELDAVKLAAHLGFPVVLKLYSETITHKTDVGGVQLNLRTAAAVRQAWRAIETAVTKKVGAEHFLGATVQPMIKLDGYELIVGSSIDPQFGPVLLFGTGGQLVEVYKDRALGLPPLNATLARRMMERTRIFSALKGVRGRQPINITALEQTMVRFSQLVIEQPWIAEIDINPLLVSSERIFALDARVVLHDASIPVKKLPRPAIRPYPIQYVTEARLADKTPVVIRPIRPEDEPLMVKFHETLSEESDDAYLFQRLRPGNCARGRTHRCKDRASNHSWRRTAKQAARLQ